MNKVKISTGNGKLGTGVWNVSVSPISGCSSNTPCAKSCYAMKAFKQYPQVKIAWEHNLDIRNRNRYDFYYSIYEQLKAAKKKPSLFRYFVSGDIKHHGEVHHIYWLAKEYPNIKFLLFTKNYDEVNYFFRYSVMSGLGELPDNLNIYFSTWPGLRMDNPYNMPLAVYVPKGQETTRSQFVCPGHCKTCRYCFDERTDVYFPHH